MVKRGTAKESSAIRLFLRLLQSPANRHLSALQVRLEIIPEINQGEFIGKINYCVPSERREPVIIVSSTSSRGANPPQPSSLKTHSTKNHRPTDGQTTLNSHLTMINLWKDYTTDTQEGQDEEDIRLLMLRSCEFEGETRLATLENTLVLLSLPRSNSPCYLAVKMAGGGEARMQGSGGGEWREDGGRVNIGGEGRREGVLPGLWGDGWVGGEEEQDGRRGTEAKVPIGEEVIGEGMRGDHGEDERGEEGAVVRRGQEKERKRRSRRRKKMGGKNNKQGERTIAVRIEIGKCYAQERKEGPSR